MKIGILGGGQLGRMLALAGYPLGLRFRFLEPAPESSAGQVAHCSSGASMTSAPSTRFAHGLDVVTYEFENVPVESARWLAERVPVYPPPQALAVSQDRLAEKTFFRGSASRLPPFAASTAATNSTRRSSASACRRC